MSSPNLPNYLLAHRKRTALSQEEVAFLLGAQSAATVCRNERFFRDPSLEMALAYGAIFDRPLSELFPGLFERVQVQVKARAKQMEQRKFRGNPALLAARKRQALAAIAVREPKKQ